MPDHDFEGGMDRLGKKIDRLESLDRELAMNRYCIAAGGVLLIVVMLTLALFV